MNSSYFVHLLLFYSEFFWGLKGMWAFQCVNAWRLHSRNRLPRKSLNIPTRRGGPPSLLRTFDRDSKNNKNRTEIKTLTLQQKKNMPGLFKDNTGFILASSSSCCADWIWNASSFDVVLVSFWNAFIVGFFFCVLRGVHLLEVRAPATWHKYSRNFQKPCSVWGFENTTVD